MNNFQLEFRLHSLSANAICIFPEGTTGTTETIETIGTKETTETIVPIGTKGTIETIVITELKNKNLSI